MWAELPIGEASTAPSPLDKYVDLPVKRLKGDRQPSVWLTISRMVTKGGKGASQYVKDILTTVGQTRESALYNIDDEFERRQKPQPEPSVPTDSDSQPEPEPDDDRPETVATYLKAARGPIGKAAKIANAATVSADDLMTIADLRSLLDNVDAIVKTN